MNEKYNEDCFWFDRIQDMQASEPICNYETEFPKYYIKECPKDCIYYIERQEAESLLRTYVTRINSKRCEHMLHDIVSRSRIIKEKFEKLYNRYLCEKYPFLNPHVENWDYEFIELDFMPDGWRKSFGLEMCEEIKKALIKNNYLNDYYIAEIKEKYGGLRWYDYGAPDEVEEIIKKYEQLSLHTCEFCGEHIEKKKPPRELFF